MSESLDVLIVAAHPMELAGLGAGFGSAPVRGLHVACCGVGVGLPAASVGTARSLRDLKPRAVILLGSCGIYPAAAEAASLLDPVVPERMQLAELAVATNQAAFPEPMPRSAAVDPALADGLVRFTPGAQRGSLATTLGITTSDDVAHSLERASGCASENLEALGVALACDAEQVPFAALLVITNVVGASGRADWLRHFKPAAERGGRMLLDWLEAGAPGVKR